MATYRIKITREIRTTEEATVTVDAESAEAALAIAEDRYSEGEYDGVPEIEWEEDVDAYDAYEHEMEIMEED